MFRLGWLLLLGCLLCCAIASADVRVNDPTGDPAGTMQNSPSVAKVHDASGGDLAVVAWRKSGTGASTHTLYVAASPLEPPAFGTAVQPPAPAGWRWSEDVYLRAPKVDPFDAGTFYLAGQVITSASPRHMGVAYVRGHAHAANSVTFDTPALLHDFGAVSSSVYFGTCTFGIHPLSGHLYLLYCPALPVVADPRALVIRRSTNNGVTWTDPLPVNADTSVVPVSPELVFGMNTGSVTAIWQDIVGPVRTFSTRLSQDGGANWGSVQTAMTLPSGWIEGPNRYSATPMSTSAVLDRWNPASFGQILIGASTSMNTSTDVFPDPASAPEYSSVESDNSPAQAPLLETVGTILRGSVSFTPAPADTDWFAWLLTEGQGVSFWCDSLSSSNLSIRAQVVGTNGTDVLQSAYLGNSFGPRFGFVAPADGTYFLRVSSSGSTTGYRIRTTTSQHPYPGAADQRDLAFARKPGSGTWSGFFPLSPATTLGCDESEVHLAGAADGALYATSTDYSEFPGQAISRRVIRRSVDGGLTWTAPAPISSANTYWPSVKDIGAEGTVQGGDMAYDDQHLLSVWVDGRGGDRDIYFDHIDRSVSATDPPPFTAVASPGQTVHVTRNVRNNDHVFPFAVRVVPDVSGLGWPAAPATVATLAPGATQTLACDIPVPANAELGLVGIPLRFQSAENPGTTYTTYVLDLTLLAPTAVGDGGGAAFALQNVSPNPMPGRGRLAFSLARAGAASLEILDVNGRRVRTLAAGELAAGPHEVQWDGRDAAGARVGAGAYFAVLHSAGQRLTRRFVVMR